MKSETLRLSRRDAIRVGVSAGLGITLGRFPLAAELTDLLQQMQLPQITRAIPATGERLPLVGISTSQYDAGTPKLVAPLCAALRKFSESEGKVLDTARHYGRSEEVVGQCLKDIGSRNQLFLSTRVSLPRPLAARSGRGAAAAKAASKPVDPAELIEQAFTRLQVDRLDLLLVQNLEGAAELLPLFQRLKETGRVRYIGVGTSNDSQYPALMDIMRSHTLDFIQVDYAINNRKPAQAVLPLALEKKIAVLATAPLGRTSALQRVRGRPLPDWARTIDCTTWNQIFLKYVVSHPAVVAAVPAANRAEQVVEYNNAARGRLPDERVRETIELNYGKST